MGGVRRGIFRYLLEVYGIRIFAGFYCRHRLGDYQLYEVPKEI